MKTININGAADRAGRYRFAVTDSETGETIGEHDAENAAEGLNYCEGFADGYAVGYNRGLETLYKKILAKYGLEPDDSFINRLRMAAGKTK